MNKVMHSRRKRNAGSISEFGAAFYAFCLAILIPTINFLSFAISLSYSFASANLTADRVAQALSPKRANKILEETTTALRSDNFANLLKVAPASDDPYALAITKTNAQGKPEVTTGSIKEMNKLLEADQFTGNLQYKITINYSIKPMIDLVSVPYINQIPLLGKETNLSFKLLRQPEHR